MKPSLPPGRGDNLRWYLVCRPVLMPELLPACSLCPFLLSRPTSYLLRPESLGTWRLFPVLLVDLSSLLALSGRSILKWDRPSVLSSIYPILRTYGKKATRPSTLSLDLILSFPFPPSASLPFRWDEPSASHRSSVMGEAFCRTFYLHASRALLSLLQSSRAPVEGG